MGEPNNALAVYMNRPDRIRSVLEYYLGGKMQGEWKCEEIRGFYAVRDSRGKLSYRQRDYLGKASLQGTCFLLGLENQDSVNLVFPWRIMELDCLAYGKEIEEIQERNREAGKVYGKKDDFKYRYRSGNRIMPVLNLTLYWGTKKWQGPLSLKDMMNDMSALPEKIRELAGDYRVNLVSMRAIPEEALGEMDSDLKYVLGIMKHTRSKKMYEKYIEDNERFFSRIPKSAVDVIDACTNIKDIRESLRFTLNRESGEEEADMCRALREIKRDAYQQGVEQGVEQGIKQGVEQGTLRTNRLIQLLIGEGRQEDLLRSASDTLFRQKLYKEYHI